MTREQTLNQTRGHVTATSLSVRMHVILQAVHAALHNPLYNYIEFGWLRDNKGGQTKGLTHDPLVNKQANIIQTGLTP